VVAKKTATEEYINETMIIILSGVPSAELMFFGYGMEKVPKNDTVRVANSNYYAAIAEGGIMAMSELIISRKAKNFYFALTVVWPKSKKNTGIIIDGNRMLIVIFASNEPKSEKNWLPPTGKTSCQLAKPSKQHHFI